MKERLRIGYSMWGFLGDIKCDRAGIRLENGSPDGCASYVWAAWHALQSDGHIIYMMQEDRDEAVYDAIDWRLFASHATEKRVNSYRSAHRALGKVPELDVLVLEWRFPVPGKTSQDVNRQRLLLEHYSQTDTKIIIWDLDHKLTEADERLWPNAIICEQSDTPLNITRPRRTLFTPVDPDVIRQSQFHRLGKRVHTVYVGNNYERERAVDQYIVPLAARGLDVRIWGKWMDVPERWSGLHFEPRIDLRYFARAFSPAACCPLLAKDTYFEGGVVTSRVWECLQWGTLPVGFKEHLGIQRFTPYVVADAYELAIVAKMLMEIDDDDYDTRREECIELQEHVHISRWIKDFQRIVGA